MNAQGDTRTPNERLLRAIRVARGLLLFLMLAAVMLVGAAVMSNHAGLMLAAKLACMAAALVALALLVLNLLALRAWRRGRRKRSTG